jgi:hypothetical protein
VCAAGAVDPGPTHGPGVGLSATLPQIAACDGLPAATSLAVPPGAARCAPHKPDHPLPCAPLIVHHDELPVAGGAGAARGVGGSGAAARAVQAAGQSLGRADLSLGFRVSGFPSPPPPPPATASAGTPPAARPPPGPPGPTATLAFWWDPLTGRYTPTLVTQYEWRPTPGPGAGTGTRRALAVAAVCPPVATLLSTNAVQVASAGVGRAVDDPTVTSGSTGVPGPSESPTIMKPVVPLTPRTRAPASVAQAVTCSLTTQTPSPSRTSHPGPTTGSTTGSATGSAVIPPVKPAPVHAHWQAAIAAPGPGRVPGPRAESGGLGLLVDSDNLNVTVKRPRLGHRDSDGPARDGAHTDADWPGVVPLVPTGRLSAPGDLARVDRDHWRVQVHVQREAHTAASTSLSGSHGASGTMPQAGAVATASCAASAASLTRIVSGAAATPADSDTLSCPYCPYQTAVVGNVSSICT